MAEIYNNNYEIRYNPKSREYNDNHETIDYTEIHKLLKENKQNELLENTGLNNFDKHLDEIYVQSNNLEFKKSKIQDLPLEDNSDLFAGFIKIGGVGAGILGKYSQKIYDYIKNIFVKSEKVAKVEINSIVKGESQLSGKIQEKIIGGSNNIYEYPNYKFLEKHKDILGEKLKLSDKIGEGNNAILFPDLIKTDRVVKVAKEGNVDRIDIEFENHKKFYDTLEQGKIDYKGQLSDNIKIPEVFKNKGIDKGYFIMEKVDGQSIKTKFYIEHYKKEFNELGYNEEKLFKLSDGQFEHLMEKHKLYGIPHIIMDNDIDSKIMSKKMTEYFNKHLYGTELGNTLNFLEWKNLKHNDLHPGNIIIGNDGNTYIIDFGRAKIK